MKISSIYFRNCRYALIPQPIDSSIIRNYTAFVESDIKKAKERLINEGFLKDFPNETLPNLNEITEISDVLKQHMFATWLNGNDGQFNKLREKFESLDVDEDVVVKKFLYVDPSQTKEANYFFGDLIFDVQFNKTHQTNLVIPEDLKEALFEGWNEHGMSLIRVLTHYGEN